MNADKPLSNREFLVIDDSSLHVMMLQTILENLGAAKVATAISGEDAMRLLATSRFDAALVDLHMINMNGIEFARQVRKNREWDSMRLVLVSADTEAVEKESAMDLFDASVSKTLLTKDLLAALVAKQACRI